MSRYRVSSIFFGIILPILVSAHPRSTVTGRVVGYDGNPMVQAHVRLTGGSGFTEYLNNLGDPEFASVRVGSDGTFTISTDSLGPLTLIFTGVGHEWLRLPLILQRPTDIDIHAQLSFLPLRREPDDPRIAYDFEDFVRGKQGILEQCSTGYAITVPTSKEKFIYGIRGIWAHPDPLSVPMATADDYEYDLEGIYKAIVHPIDGKVHIAIDGAIVRPLQTAPIIAFTDSETVPSRYVMYHRRFQDAVKQYERARQDFMRNGGIGGEFSYDWTPFRTEIKAGLQTESAPLLTDELSIEYLETALLSKNPSEESLACSLLSTVSPRSCAWVYHGTTALRSGRVHPRGEAYAQEIIDTHPTATFRAYLLYWLASYAKHEKRVEEYQRYRAVLAGKYPETPAGRLGIRSDLRESKLTVGMTLPPFTWTSLDDSTRTISDKEFRGKYLLMDFWATWCGPCVAEMPHLHAAHERFRGPHFAMLSVSFDPKASVVKYFRSTRWKMPWMNAYIEPERQPAVSLAFAVSFPKPILIDPSGKIVEEEDALRGANLERTLSKYLPARE